MNLCLKRFWCWHTMDCKTISTEQFTMIGSAEALSGPFSGFDQPPNTTQDCIPVGCIPPACWPYLLASTAWGGCVCFWVSLVLGGCLLRGVWYPSMHWGRPPHGQTDTCENITLPQTSISGGNKTRGFQGTALSPDLPHATGLLHIWAELHYPKK